MCQWGGIISFVSKANQFVFRLFLSLASFFPYLWSELHFFYLSLVLKVPPPLFSAVLFFVSLSGEWIFPLSSSSSSLFSLSLSAFPLYKKFISMQKRSKHWNVILYSSAQRVVVCVYLCYCISPSLRTCMLFSVYVCVLLYLFFWTKSAGIISSYMRPLAAFHIIWHREKKSHFQRVMKYEKHFLPCPLSFQNMALYKATSCFIITITNTLPFYQCCNSNMLHHMHTNTA